LGRIAAGWGFALAMMITGLHGPLRGEPLALRNEGLEIEIDSASGGLTRVVNRLTNETYDISSPAAGVETTAGRWQTTEVESTSTNDDSAAFQQDFGPVAVDIEYRLPAGQDYLEKIVTVHNQSDSTMTLHQLVMGEMTFTPAFRQIREHHDPNIWRTPINVFLRDKQGGFYLGIANPMMRFHTRGATPRSNVMALTYEPAWVLGPRESYRSEPLFLGAYRNEGIYLFRELRKQLEVIDQPISHGSHMNWEQQILDWGEVWAMRKYLRDIMPPHDTRRPGYYVRAVAMVGGSTSNTWGEEAEFHVHFEEKHLEGSRAFVDQVAELGHVPHIEWATEWYGVGGYTNPTPDHMLERAGPGQKPPVNPYWQQVIEYAQSKGIAGGIFETVTRNFAEGRDDWKVLQVDGTPWTWDPDDRPINCWANRDYVDWRLEVTDQAVNDFDLYMVAWDSASPAFWTWFGFPEVQTECHATNHGHPPGDITYHLFRNIAWFLEELQARHPRLALRVACGATRGYPWILKHLIEYHPNLYDGEMGSTYWVSYNFRFLPIYKSGLLLSANTREEFEYLLLRSIANSDHFMLWPDAVPIALEHKAFWDRWITWADEHIDFLRTGRTLFREPWGDDMVASLHPALEGSLPADDAQISGVSHCLGDRGFLFLFNPDDQPRAAQIPVNHWLGLESGDRFAITTLYPGDGESLGVFNRGDLLTLRVEPDRACVLAIEPAADADAAPIPQDVDGLPVDKAFLTWDEIPWREIMIP